MTTWTTLGGAGTAASSAHPFTTEDILTPEGGLLTRRGKVLYSTDFRDGYSGFLPVHNAGGKEGAHGPHSLVDYPRSGLRIAAPGPWSTQASDVSSILRLSRPRAADMVASVSFRYAQINELLPSAPAATAREKQLRQFGFGFDTQSWDNTERQFFQVFIENTSNRNSDRVYLRSERTAAGNIQKITVPMTANSTGLMVGANENKTNLAYARLTVRVGKNPDYLELQMGGRVVDLRGLVAAGGQKIAEPLQLSPDDYSANFGGGFNPFFNVMSLPSATNLAQTGVILTDVCVTYGDEVTE